MDDQPPIDAFAVWAEAEGQARPLLMIGLTLARLFDDIVVPYQTGEPFFVDGVPVKGKELKRIKILRAMPGLSNSLALFNRTLHSGDPKLQQIYGDQYHTRLEAILRQRTETSQARSSRPMTGPLSLALRTICLGEKN